MGEDLLDHHRTLDAGDDLDVAAAGLAGLDVDAEDTLQTLTPVSHSAPTETLKCSGHAQTTQKEIDTV